MSLSLPALRIASRRWPATLALRPQVLLSSPSQTIARSLARPTRAYAVAAAGSSAARSNISAARQANTMPIETSMREKLTREFAPEVLTIRNDSSKHAHHAAMVAQGGGNGETHFFVEIISNAFEGKTQIARHRAINTLMKDEFEEGLHALSLRTKTPAEAEREKEWIKAQTGSSGTS